MRLNEQDFEPDDLSVRVAELLVATADSTDEQIDNSVHEVLKLLRERLKMDVVFVSEFIDGKRVFQKVESTGRQVIAEGGCDPVEESWCIRVVDGRMPQLVNNAATHPATADLKLSFPVGAHLSTPIVLKYGRIYGTLCCFSFGANESLNQRDLKNLQYTAQLMAAKIDMQLSRQQKAADASRWGLEPIQPDLKRM
ncbi:MAG: GAF domain-containing protein [Burkholderiales bacterium]